MILRALGLGSDSAEGDNPAVHGSPHARHLFADRREAGRQLAARLTQYREQKPVILALPRGGVPVGYEIAKGLQAPLDVLLVRKICAPEQPELGLGAVVDGATPQVVLNDDLVERLGVNADYIAQERLNQMAEIERRRQLYRGDTQAVDTAGRLVVIADDGIATGATVKAALLAIMRTSPAHLVLAVPVAAPDALQMVAPMANETICLATPEDFEAVGGYYADFDQTSDEEVIDLLAAARYGI